MILFDFDNNEEKYKDSEQDAFKNLKNTEIKYDDELLDTFNSITKKYDDDLFDIFKSVIDKSNEEAKKIKMNSIETFIYVNQKLELSFIQLSLSLGIISDVKHYIEFYRDNPPISEKLLKRICNYMESITLNAKEELKNIANEVLDAYDLEELHEKYNKLNLILENDVIDRSDYLTDGLILKRKNNIKKIKTNK